MLSVTRSPKHSTSTCLWRSASMPKSLACSSSLALSLMFFNLSLRFLLTSFFDCSCWRVRFCTDLFSRQGAQVLNPPSSRAQPHLEHFIFMIYSMNHSFKWSATHREEIQNHKPEIKIISLKTWFHSVPAVPSVPPPQGLKNKPHMAVFTLAFQCQMGPNWK